MPINMPKYFSSMFCGIPAAIPISDTTGNRLRCSGHMYAAPKLAIPNGFIIPDIGCCRKPLSSMTIHCRIWIRFIFIPPTSACL